MKHPIYSYGIILQAELVPSSSFTQLHYQEKKTIIKKFIYLQDGQKFRLTAELYNNYLNLINVKVKSPIRLSFKDVICIYDASNMKEAIKNSCSIIKKLELHKIFF